MPGQRYMTIGSDNTSGGRRITRIPVAIKPGVRGHESEQESGRAPPCELAILDSRAPAFRQRLVPTVLDVLPDIADRVVQTERVGLMPNPPALTGALCGLGVR